MKKPRRSCSCFRVNIITRRYRPGRKIFFLVWLVRRDALLGGGPIIKCDLRGKSGKLFSLCIVLVDLSRPARDNTYEIFFIPKTRKASEKIIIFAQIISTCAKILTSLLIYNKWKFTCSTFMRILRKSRNLHWKWISNFISTFRSAFIDSYQQYISYETRWCVSDFGRIIVEPPDQPIHVKQRWRHNCQLGII